MRHENKFKVGDRVRAIHTSGGNGVQKGDVFVVTKSEDGFLNFFNDRVGRNDGWGANNFELALTIEPGKHYRTRNGKVTGRVSMGDTGFEAVVDGKVRIYDAAGGAVYSDDDIVEAWVPKVGERVRFIQDYDHEVAGQSAIVIDVPPTSWAFRVRLERDGDESTELRESLEPLPVASQPAAQEPAPPVLKIEAGRYNRTRDGRKVGPMERDDWGDGQPWTDGERWYCEDGQWARSEINDNDLIAEWQEPTTNVGAQVDTLAEEYGSARVATTSNDNAPGEPDTTLHIKFTSDFSELDAAILVRKKKLKKLIKLASKAGIDLREAA